VESGEVNVRKGLDLMQSQIPRIHAVGTVRSRLEDIFQARYFRI